MKFYGSTCSALFAGLQWHNEQRTIIIKIAVTMNYISIIRNVLCDRNKSHRLNEQQKTSEITRNNPRTVAHMRNALAARFSHHNSLTHLSIVCDICCCCSGIGGWVFIALEPPSFCLCGDDDDDSVACLYWLSEKNNVNIAVNRPAQISFALIVSTSQCRSRNAFRQLFTFSNCSIIK